ncbi:hypothetical protein NPIL_490861 [Nephila pilipes]|uniref:Uncharacterized protein n=1 Tax=Nephila pilipes TaxID=299642 RepID=A0A8X6Q006_NEPPI|nr:hypothetical protein NPIL_490861 [Nephila pilipes]
MDSISPKIGDKYLKVLNILPSVEISNIFNRRWGYIKPFVIFPTNNTTEFMGPSDLLPSLINELYPTYPYNVSNTERWMAKLTTLSTIDNNRQHHSHCSSPSFTRSHIYPATFIT